MFNVRVIIVAEDGLYFNPKLVTQDKELLKSRGKLLLTNYLLLLVSAFDLQYHVKVVRTMCKGFSINCIQF